MWAAGWRLAARMALFLPPAAPSPSLSVSQPPTSPLSLPLLFCILIDGPKADYKPGLSNWLLIFLTVCRPFTGTEVYGNFPLLLSVRFIVFTNSLWNTVDRKSTSPQLLSGACVSPALFCKKVKFLCNFVLSARGGQCPSSDEEQ